MIPKGEQVDTACCRCNGCVLFEFDDKPLHTKNDYELRGYINLAYLYKYLIKFKN